MKIYAFVAKIKIFSNLRFMKNITCNVSKIENIIPSDLRFMNGSTAHLVVVAEDSGVPPRRASVPVVVRSMVVVSAVVVVVVVVLVVFVVVVDNNSFISINIIPDLPSQLPPLELTTRPQTS